MKADLSEQVHGLIEHGLHPVTMSDIKSRVPVRTTVLQRTAARSRLGGSRLLLNSGRPTAVGLKRGVSPAGHPGRARRAVMAAAAATASLAAVTAIASIASVASPSRPTIDKGAVVLLGKVADAAARRPVPHPRDGQYMYLESRAAVPPQPTGWSGQRVSSRRLRDKPDLKLVTERIWVPVGRTCGTGLRRPGAGCPGMGWLNDPTYRLLQTLPANPRALLAMIYRVERGHGPGSAQEAFVTIGDLLRNTIAPPSVTAALYRAAALIPGVALIPHASDAIGRPGVAVARVGPGVGGVRDELVFSRNTLQLIGERTVIARTGETTSATAIIARAFVDRWGQVPPQA